MKIEFDSSTESAPVVVDTYVPVDPWPRIAPDLLDIDLRDMYSVLQAKLLDGSPGVYLDGAPTGLAIHYGDMQGDVDYTYTAEGNVISGYDQKFSNPSVKPRFGVEPNGLHYLESATDMSYAFPPGVTGNRLINWQFSHFKPCAEMWSRYLVWYDPCILQGQGNIGIKGSGLGGGGMSQTFEIGPVQTIGWEAQNYAYDAEGAQRVERFGLRIFPGKWHVIEEHVRVNTMTGAVYNSDGVVEYKVNGDTVFSRKDVLLFAWGAPQLSTFQMQFYDGGQLPVKSVVPPPSLRARHARIAVSTKGWIGPPKEWP